MTARLPNGPEAITERQLEVARLVAEGKTNPEIAEALGISLDGAKYHVSELLGRLGLERREEVAAWYRAQAGPRWRRRARALLAGAAMWFAAGSGATALAFGVVLLFVALSGGRSLPLEATPAPEAAAAREPVGRGTETLGESTGPRQPGSDWLQPVDGRVVQAFGPEHPRGVDIEADEGTPVRASAAGEVTYAGGNGCCSYGLHVIVDHGEGWETVYAHLDAVQVRQGQRVEAGEIVGLAGATGHAEEPGLHFEIRRDGVHQNPAEFLADVPLGAVGPAGGPAGAGCQSRHSAPDAESGDEEACGIESTLLAFETTDRCWVYRRDGGSLYRVGAECAPGHVPTVPAD